MTAPYGCHPFLFSLAPPGPSTHDDISAIFRGLLIFKKLKLKKGNREVG
jgi:hypothetical protein